MPAAKDPPALTTSQTSVRAWGPAKARATRLPSALQEIALRSLQGSVRVSLRLDIEDPDAAGFADRQVLAVRAPGNKFRCRIGRKDLCSTFCVPKRKLASPHPGQALTLGAPG